MFTTSFQPQCSFSGKFEQIPHWQGQCNAGLVTAHPYYVPQVPEIRYGYTPGETVSHVAPPTLIADSAYMYKQHNKPLVVTTASIHPNQMTAYRDSQPMMEQLHSSMSYADQQRVPRQTRSTVYTAAPPSADRSPLPQAILQGHQQKRYPEGDVFTEEDEFLIEQRIMRRTATCKALQQLDDELGKIELLMENEEGRRCLDRAFKNSEPDKSIIMPYTQSGVETPVILPILQIDIVEMETVTDLANKLTEKATIVLPDISIYHVATEKPNVSIDEHTIIANVAPGHLRPASEPMAITDVITDAVSLTQVRNTVNTCTTVNMSNITIDRNLNSSELKYTENEDEITPDSVGKIGENATLDETSHANSELYAHHALTDSPGGTHAAPAFLSATLPRSSDCAIVTCVPSCPQEPANRNTVDDHKHDKGNSPDNDVSGSTISEPLWSPSGQPTTSDNEYIATGPSPEGNTSASNAGTTNLEPLRTPIGPSGDTNNEPVDVDGKNNDQDTDTSFTILEPLRSPSGEPSSDDGRTLTSEVDGGATKLEPLRPPVGGLIDDGIGNHTDPTLIHSYHEMCTTDVT